MSGSGTIKAAGVALVAAACTGTVFALLIAAVSAVSVFFELTAPLNAGALAWVLNPAVLMTPFIFGAAALLARQAIRETDPRRLLLSLGLCLVAAALIGIYLRFDPLLKIDSCLDAGGVWENETCER